MIPPKLVIFDCDGVLVDTETIANTMLAQWLTEAGKPTTMVESRSRFLGRTVETIGKMVRAEDGIDLGEDLPIRWQTELEKRFKGSVAAINGIENVIAVLKRAGIPFCVASAGSIQKMHVTLGSAGLLSDFADVLFTAQMVARGKPAPDLFLHAASQLGYEPEACAVIEDSKFGVIGAIAAGMKCFGYIGDPLTEASALAENGAVLFDDMNNLPALLGLD